MTESRRRFPWRKIKLGILVAGLGALAVGLSSLHVTRRG